MPQLARLEAGVNPLHFLYSQYEGRSSLIRYFAPLVLPAFLQSPELMSKYHEDLDLRIANSGDEKGRNFRFRKERNQIVDVNTGEYGTKYFATLGEYPVQSLLRNPTALDYLVNLHNNGKADVKVLPSTADTYAALEGEFVILDYTDDYGNDGQIGFRANPNQPITDPGKLQRLEERFTEISEWAEPLPQFLERVH